MTQQKTNDMALIGKIVVVVPRFTQWTGTRAMHEGDYTIGTGGQLPPKEVTKSLGLKAIIDTQELRVFDRIKHKAEVLLEGCGVKYLSGWAIPEDKANEVFKSLDALVEQYSMEKADFLSRYDALVKDWADKNPSFSKEIMEGKLDVNAVSERINARSVCSLFLRKKRLLWQKASEVLLPNSSLVSRARQGSFSRRASLARPVPAAKL